VDGHGDGKIGAMRLRLLRWYAIHKRDLPWRRTSDPYAIWVSEAMLQQTRVDVVVAYYGRWMASFPTLRTLAAARESDVLSCWAGLGYYSRARNLRKAARLAGGRLPTTYDGLLGLPGIGPYTAAAVASIAFGEPRAVLDGNVERVASRLLGVRDPRQGAGRAQVRKAVDRWLSPSRPGDWNQAMMELGATVCTPRGPKCGSCPVSAFCAARRSGTQHAIPIPKPRRVAVAEKRRYAVVLRGDRLLVTGGQEGLLKGMDLLPGGPSGRPLARLVKEQTGVDVRLDGWSGKATHAFSHRVWQMEARKAVPRGGVLLPYARWVPVSELRRAAIPAAMRPLLEQAGLWPPGRERKAKTGRDSSRTT
jgi:A/G-specific adenine glycosylase